MQIEEKSTADKLLKQRKRFVLWVSRPSTIQRDEVAIIMLSKIIGSDYAVIPLTDGNTAYFCDKNKLDIFYNYYGRKLESSERFKQHFDDYYNLANKLLAISKKATKFSSDKEELLEIFNNWIKVLENYSIYLLMPFLIEYRTEPLLKSLLLQEYKSKYNDIFNIIASPTIVFRYQQYQIALAGMGKDIDFKYLIDNYKWITEYSYKERLLNKQCILDDAKKINSEIFSIERKIKENKENYERLIDSLPKNSRLRILIELVHNYVNIRTARIEIFKEAQCNFRNFYKSLAFLMKKSIGAIRYLDVVSLTNQEIIDFLNNKPIAELSEIRKRKNRDYIIWGNKKKRLFIYDKKLIKAVRNDFSDESTDQEFFNGISANKGKISGQVRIINNKREFKKFNNGEILVTQFTTSEFVPIMKKAKAIITNDGGITCHAAIISRELGIPCVVGTKIATKVLKDGDWVEMDANRGAVKILKRTE